MKKLVCISSMLLVFISLFSDVKLIDYYPKILTFNYDNINERIFFKYFNDKGCSLVLRVYDINGILVSEQKITGSIKEKPNEDGSYFYSFDPQNDSFHVQHSKQGVYIFTISNEDERKILSKGSFVVVK